MRSAQPRSRTSVHGGRLQAQRLAAGHPVFAAVNRGPLPAEALRELEAVWLLALHDLAAGKAALPQCLDLRNLLTIAVDLASCGVGGELLPEVAELLRDVRAALAAPTPVNSMQSLLARLVGVQALLAEQRAMVTRAEWLKAMIAVCGAAGRSSGLVARARAP